MRFEWGLRGPIDGDGRCDTHKMVVMEVASVWRVLDLLLLP